VWVLWVRYESALQVVAFLKRTHGTPVPILHIAQNIELSYQPTHKHVRALEQRGVVETAKEGRVVLCRLRATQATHLWLSLLAVEEREKLIESHTVAGSLASMLREAVPEMPCDGLEALAVQTPSGDGPLAAILLAESYARDRLAARFKTRCRPLRGATEIHALTFAEVAERIADPVERDFWVANTSPLYGEQRFWETVLPVDGDPPLVTSL